MVVLAWDPMMEAWLTNAIAKTIISDITSTALSIKIVPTSLSAGTFSYLPRMVHFSTSPNLGTAKLAK